MTFSCANIYTWTSNNSNLPQIAVAPLSSTIYTVSGTATSGCISTATLSIKVAMCGVFGIHENSFGQFNLYPVPAHNEMWLEREQNGILTITDLNGRVIRKMEFDPGKNQLNLDGVGPGMYIISLKRPHISGNRKIVIE